MVAGRVLGSRVCPIDAARHALRLDAVPPLRPQRPAAAGHLARPLAQLRRRPAARDARAPSCAAPSTSASPTSTWRTTTARRYGSAEETFGRIMRRRPAPLPRRARASRRRPATTCGPARTASGARASTCSPRSTSRSTRMGLDYVDIFYSHRFDPETPLEETMGALDTAVRSGKALYVGISSYSPEKTREAYEILRALGTPLLIHQPSYSMLNRWIEPDLLDTLGEARRRLHRLLAARAGHADRQVPERHPARARARPRTRRSRPTCSPTRRSPRSAALNEIAAAARADARAAGARLDAARPADDLDADRRLERRAARGLARRAREPRLLRRRAGGDRRLRGRRDSGINLWARSSSE